MISRQTNPIHFAYLRFFTFRCSALDLQGRYFGDQAVPF